MKKTLTLAILSCALLAFAAVAGEAETVTVEGKVVCAKCALHEEGRTECQNVLVVEKEKGDVQHYYLAATKANEKFGEVCMTKPYVAVTGTIEKKDGQIWLAATEIKPVDKEG